VLEASLGRSFAPKTIRVILMVNTWKDALAITGDFLDQPCASNSKKCGFASLRVFVNASKAASLA
jgi:hypothetical protein